MADPFVSIIIPCYNGAAIVREAITSALQQAYQNKEVIVVDDGSTDESLDVIRSFGDQIHYVIRKNGGVATARNTGAAIARGELLQFLDQDDLLYSNKLELQVPLAVAHRPGMVFCDADIINFKNNYQGHWCTGYVSTNDPIVHVLSTTLQTSGPLHWQETFNLVGGFREQAPPCEDRDLHMRMACAGVSFYHMSERLYLLRRISGSQSTQNMYNGLNKQYYIGENTYILLKNTGQLTDSRRLALAGFMAGTGRQALRYGLSQLAEKCFQKAKEIHPEGGLPQAYSKGAQILVKSLGPKLTERVVALKRFIFQNRDIA